MSTTQYTVQVEGNDKSDTPDHKTHLLAQLDNIPRSARALCVTEDTPSNTEWGLLGEHFTDIQDLELEAGFNEDLNDTKLPTEWPLERLLISGSCAEAFTTPFVLEGRVKHLILHLTHGLLFEGPTSDELYRMHYDAIKRGEKEPEYIGKIQVTYFPNLVVENMQRRRQWVEASRPAGMEDQLLLPKDVSTQMVKLEILENDALDAFTRMTMGLPHVVENLATVNLRSTNNCDFQYRMEPIFVQILPQLTKMNTFILTVGEVFEDGSDTLYKLYQYLPPNITTLRFRGPTLIAMSTEWDRWVESFASSEFLPKLERLSFVLDLYYPEEKSDWGKRRLAPAPDDVLREAWEACRRLHRGVEKRGVVVEPFHDEWSDRFEYLKQVDARWEQD